MGWKVGERDTLYEKVIRRFKNNPVTCALLLLGTIAIAIAAATDAGEQIVNLIRGITKPAKIDVTGAWRTKMLEDAWFSNKHYELLFEFQTEGDRLFGVINERYARGDPEKKAILGGKIQGKHLSFYTLESVWTSKMVEPYKPRVPELVSYKHFYEGTVLDDRIEFLKYCDRAGYQPWNFEAIRE
jgi:hypothetical protein